MAVSRIAFAIADLRDEIQALVGTDYQLEVIIGLSADAHAKVVAEVEHSIGNALQPVELDGARGVKFLGVMLVVPNE